MSSNFILLQKLEDFADYLYPIIDHFPNREKWALCAQIKRQLDDEIIRRAIRVQKIRNKGPLLFDLDVELDYLRILIRRAHTRKFLSGQKLKTATAKLSEIGKILGGMIRSSGVRP